MWPRIKKRGLSESNDDWGRSDYDHHGTLEVSFENFVLRVLEIDENIPTMYKIRDTRTTKSTLQAFISKYLLRNGWINGTKNFNFEIELIETFIFLVSSSVINLR